jgi:mycofactocin system creatininase family protein
VTSLLGSRTSPSLSPGSVVIVPVGSLEQHGPHLPLDTDSTIAEAVAVRAGELLADEHVVVAPPVAYGSSGEHQSFAGTSSVGTDVLAALVVQLVRSMRTWATRVVLVNGHGGNVPALRSGVSQLVAEGHDTGWAACVTEDADAHAGFAETSVMLHLRPGDVHPELAEPGNPAPVAELLPAMVRGGVVAVSANGVLGDPRRASAIEGRRLLQQMARQVATAVRSGAPDAGGRLR